MTSTYSTNLKLTLMGTGDQSGTWGDTTNTNLGTLVEEAVAGYTTQALTGASATTTLTIPDGATSVGRNYVIEFTGTPTVTHTVIVPTVDKPYLLFNNTSISVLVKTTAGTGVTIAAGKKAIVYANSTDVVEVANAPVTEAGTQTLTNKTLGATTVTADITMSGTGQIKVPASTTANRSASPASGMFRFNTDNVKFEGYNGTAWGTVGGGATGGGTDEIFIENGQTVTSNYTITASKNAGTFGPITVNSSITVTVPSGSTWSIV